MKDSKILTTKLEGEIDTLQSQLKSLDEPPKESKRPYLESINLKISAKEVELECPVCLETASSPIYMCQEQHLVSSSCRPKISTCPECREPYTEGRSGVESGAPVAQLGASGAQSGASGAQSGASGARFRRHRYAERAGRELEALRKERKEIRAE